MDAAKNRAAFSAYMENGSVLVMFAGEEQIKRSDEPYRFTPKRNFYYMTGIDRPKIILVMRKIAETVSETLYIERSYELKAKWTGDVLGTGQAKEISGVAEICYIDEFYDSFSSSVFRNSLDKIYLDLENRYWNAPVSEDILFANEIKTRYPHAEIVNAYNIFAGLRSVKSDSEVENIQKAIDITAEGLLEIMKNSRPGMFEYELEAYFDFVLKKNGVMDKAFTTIAASGANAAILHYSENNAKTFDGSMVLFDLGAQWNYYSADVTRTFPVNGRFSSRQKQLYEIVLNGGCKVISAIRPGIKFSCLNEILKEYYVEELQKIGLISDGSELSKYYFHGVSHMLGLETHDIGRGSEGVLKKGMVFTVEPGLYIPEESIGIRIEDDVLVTDGGCVVLSAAIPKTVSEIEALMAESK